MRAKARFAAFILLGVAGYGTRADTPTQGGRDAIWIHAEQATLSPLMVRGSQVSLADAESLGDFILPSVTAMEE